MKKSLLAVAILATAFAGCQKNDSEENTDATKVKARLITSNKEQEKEKASIKNIHDEADTRVNMALYDAGVALREAIRCNPALNKTIYTLLANNNRSLTIKQLIDLEKLLNAPYTASLIAQTTLSRLTPKTLDQIASEMVYKNIQYLPSVYFVNANKADFSKLPIIAIGADVATEEDAILGWRLDNLNCTYTPDVLTSDEYLNTTNPVLIINNTCPGYIDRSHSQPTTSTGGGTYNFPPTFPRVSTHLTAYNPYHRYENDKRSEVFFQTGAILNGIIYANGIGEQHLGNFYAGDEGHSQFPSPRTFFNYASDVFQEWKGSRGNYNDPHVFGLTFEKDNSSNDKPTVVEDPFTHKTYTFYPRMKYYGEFFCRIGLNHGMWREIIYGFMKPPKVYPDVYEQIYEDEGHGSIRIDLVW